MNSYQKRIVDLSKINVNHDAQIHIIENELQLKQCENAYIENFDISIESKGISAVTIGEKNYFAQDGILTFSLDFTKRASEITLHFVNGIADDCTIEIKYVETSKSEWDEKVAKEVRDNLLKNAQIKHSTGIDLVNIYFQPCNDAYDRTEITLYTGDQLMAKYKIENEVFFKSITGLAFGRYYYEVSQFDSNNNLIVKSDKIEFSLFAPRTPTYNNNNGFRRIVGG